MTNTVDPPPLEEFLAAARTWLAGNAELRPERSERVWGEGSDSVAIFHDMTFEEEAALLDDARSWQRRKADAGYASIDWAPELGGAGLPSAYARAFAREEGRYLTPTYHEAMGITLELIGPTIRAWSTPEQSERLLRRLRRTDDMWCQLFSEPGAGSDLARLSTRALRDGDEWVIDGQKVWTSGARHADYGYIICRTDPDVPKHVGLTAFLVPMHAPGVDVRPLRQMSGGASFNEVFFDSVRISDEMRLGGVGDGWRVAMTTLGFERGSAGGGGGTGRWSQVQMLAEHLGLTNDPVTRQELAALYSRLTVASWNNQRVAAGIRAGQTPGPEGSIGKLAYTEGLRAVGDLVARMLGARFTADTGEWGTFAWTEHVTGTPGYRIAAGSDEVQRNIIGERVLGLPAEPRIDRDAPFAELMRS
jgi:alkylation response protein AidB-like acyl-CoA dehydrogenase